MGSHRLLPYPHPVVTAGVRPEPLGLGPPMMSGPSRSTSRHALRLGTVALAAGFGLLVAACGAAPSSTVHKAPSSVSFAVSEDLFGQAIIAQQKGYFKAHGISATVTNYATGVSTLEAALTGRADFAAALAFPAITYLKSHQLVIVAADMHPAPGFYSLAVHGPINFPQGLAGATFGLETGTDQIYQTSAYLQHYGLSLSKVKTVQFSDLFGMVAALRAGDISAALVYEQGIPESKAIPGVTIYPDELTAGVEPAYIVTTRSFLSKNSAVVVSALTALKEANTWMLANMKTASQIVGTFAGAPPAVLYPSMKGEDYTVSWSSSDLSSFNAIAKVLVTQHLVTVAPNPSQDLALGPITKVDKG